MTDFYELIIRRDGNIVFQRSLTCGQIPEALIPYAPGRGRQANNARHIAMLLKLGDGAYEIGNLTFAIKIIR